MSRLKKIHQRASTLFKGAAGNLDGLEEALTKLAEDPALCLVPAAWAQPLFELDPIRFAPFILEHADPRFIPKLQRDKFKDTVDQNLADQPATEVTDARIFLASSMSDPSTWTPNGDHILKNVEQILLTPVDELAKDIERKDTWLLPDVFACRLLKRHPEIIREWLLSQVSQDREGYLGNLAACTHRLLLAKETRQDGTEVFKHTAGGDAWHQVVLVLLNQSHSVRELVEQLEVFQPRLFIRNGARTIDLMIRRRPEAGREYLRRNVDQLRMDGFDTLLDELSRIREWELHDTLARHLAGVKRYQALITQLAQHEDPNHAIPRLKALTGATQVWHGSNASDIALTDDTALQLYWRWPELLAGHFSGQLQPSFGFSPMTRKANEFYPKLFTAAVEAEDNAVADLLAARALSQKKGPWDRTEDNATAHFAMHYSSLAEKDFVHRAANVFAHFSPNHSHHWYLYRRTNPVYSVFFDAPERYLSVPSLVADFLESAQPAVRGLAWRILNAGGEQTVSQASQYPQHLLAVPLDRLGPKDMAAALRVIARCARDDRWLAKLLLPRLREMSSLYKATFRREHLAHAMAQILAVHPELRRSSEEPVVFEHASMRST